MLTTPLLRLSERLAQLTPSATVALNGKMSQMKARGIDVISFGQGEPDFPTPAPIKAAAVQAIDANKTRYTPAGGIAELREAVAQRLLADSGISYTAAQISITSGVKEGLFLAFLAVCDTGDEVIVPAPYWVSYIEQVRLAGATPVVIATDEATRFKVTPAMLEQHLTPRTRVFVLSSPSNPTGAVYTAEELHALAEVLRQPQFAGVLIFTDEIYDQICYIPYARWLRVAPDLAERTLVFNGWSKTYAMTGWRLGYVAGAKPILTAIRDIQGHSTTHPNSVAQYAALAAYTPSAEIEATIATMVQAFHARRDLILAALAQLDGVTCDVPDGAFYVFPNVTALLNRPFANGTTCATSLELADYLLEHAQIGLVPGEAFGAPGYMRLAYAQSNDAISEGMRRFAAAVA